MRGCFITFEGPEGSGKTTQARRLAERLRARGCRVVVAREPGGTPTGEAIREVLQHDAGGEIPAAETETLLFAACRAQLVRTVILPALAKGACVICDRFADSTLAYQGYGRGMDVGQIARLNAFATCGVTPDLTLLLDIDVKKGLKRVAGRNSRSGARRDRIESETLGFHRKVRAGYLAMARQWPRRIVRIGSDRSPEAVERDVWKQVNQRLNRKGKCRIRECP